MATVAELQTSFPRAGGASARALRWPLWTGRALSALAALFLAWDAIMKVLALPISVDATVELGFAADAVVGLGLVELICVVLYAIPRTAALGAILLTGWLGGAIAPHLRLGNPMATHTLFPIYVAALIWGGLWLRQARVRGLVTVAAEGR